MAYSYEQIEKHKEQVVKNINDRAITNGVSAVMTVLFSQLLGKVSHIVPKDQISKKVVVWVIKIHGRVFAKFGRNIVDAYLNSYDHEKEEYDRNKYNKKLNSYSAMEWLDIKGIVKHILKEVVSSLGIP